MKQVEHLCDFVFMAFSTQKYLSIFPHTTISGYSILYWTQFHPAVSRNLTIFRYDFNNYYIKVKWQRFKKTAWIWSHHLHLQWKFKLLVGLVSGGNKAKHCWVMSTNFLFSNVCWQCPAMFCLYTSSKLSRP